MMRSPHFVAVAIRTPDQKIRVKNSRYRAWAHSFPFLKRPLIRGVVQLIESMKIGMEALSFSAEVAIPEEEAKPSSSAANKWAITLSMVAAIIFGLGLFVALPHGVAAALISDPTSFAFHALDGAVKLAILIGYIYAISFMPDIRRVFQYHGAEHKSISTFEAGEKLDPNSASRFSVQHPRCGTSFMLFLVAISILFFSVIFPWMGLSQMAKEASGLYKVWLHVQLILVKMVLMMPVAGVSYEVIKWSASRLDRPGFRWLIAPGLLLQKLTTREPDSAQLDVALASLKVVLASEKQLDQAGESSLADWVGDRVYSSSAEIPSVSARVQEFPE